MTTISIPHTDHAVARTAGPGRRILVVLAVVYVALFAVLILISSDNQPDADPAKLIAANDISHTLITVTSYAGMVACAVLVFFGAALRASLASRGRHWTTDAAFIGFVAMALTLASWGVSSLALWHAEDIGDPAVVRALNIVDSSNFLPAMLAMMCALIGTGVTTLRSKALPTWLSVASIVLGCLAPLGPAGFLPFLLFPVWMIVVAAMLRLTDAPSVEPV